MIIRIVKMTFEPSRVEDFVAFSLSIKDKIKSLEGCEHLDILQDIQQSNIFFSYSHWLSEKHLNDYRSSPFFKKTWSHIKGWFGEKPKAWSVKKI